MGTADTPKIRKNSSSRLARLLYGPTISGGDVWTSQNEGVRTPRAAWHHTWDPGDPPGDPWGGPPGILREDPGDTVADRAWIPSQPIPYPPYPAYPPYPPLTPELGGGKGFFILGLGVRWILRWILRGILLGVLGGILGIPPHFNQK